MIKNKILRFITNFKFAWSFAKLENKHSSTSLTAYEKASSFDMIQNRYFNEIEEEKNYLKTLWHIYASYKDNPEKLKGEFLKLLEFWDEGCDCTDAKIFNYNYTGEDDESLYLEEEE